MNYTDALIDRKNLRNPPNSVASSDPIQREYRESVSLSLTVSKLSLSTDKTIFPLER